MFSMSDQASCAHMSISYRTEQVDALFIRGWWECDSECGTRFGPINSSFISMIHATCQYSRLVKFERPAETPSERRVEIVHTIKSTAIEWHTKPGAVYLGHDDYHFIHLPFLNKVPVGIAKIPDGYFLLTDGQELMD